MKYEIRQGSRNTYITTGTGKNRRDVLVMPKTTGATETLDTSEDTPRKADTGTKGKDGTTDGKTAGASEGASKGANSGDSEVKR